MDAPVDQQLAPGDLHAASLARGLGLADAYPFVLAAAAIEKLRFVHGVLNERASGYRNQATGLCQEEGLRMQVSVVGGTRHPAAGVGSDDIDQRGVVAV